MPKLKLDYEYLETLFSMDYAKTEISLLAGEDGKPPTSLNSQKLYNWYRENQDQFSNNSYRNHIDGSGFIALQPVITFKNGLKINIPDVDRFFVHGVIATEEEGGSPFNSNSRTSIIMSQYARPHARLFLSHSSKDKEFVRQLRNILMTVCETFFDETDIFPGQSITHRLDEELEKTEFLGLIYSKHSASSEWVRKEWASMLHMAKPVFVIKIDDHELLPLLKDIKYIKYTGDVGEVADEISSGIGAM